MESWRANLEGNKALMTDAKTCPRCGRPIAADAPQGLCPTCLMNASLAGGETRPPSESPESSAPDSTEGHPPSGSRFTPPPPAELAAHFPQLEILEILGQGGMGVVYRARQRGLERDVALKVLPPEVGQDPEFADRFTREARALARLSHSSIVSVFDFGRAGGLYYFIMELVDGPNIRQLLKAGRLSAREALAVVPQICDALQYAHEEGIVHRDIKPENVLIDRKGRVKIADFGLAKLIQRKETDTTLTGPRQVMGTLHYMAPEQLERPAEVDHRADIYSLGVMFYEMLTGELPLGRFEPPSHRAAVDGRLDGVVLKSLERDPDRRYQHVSEVKTDVETVTKGESFPSAVAVLGEKNEFPRRFWIGALAIAGVILLAGLALVYGFLWRDGGVDGPVAELFEARTDDIRREHIWESLARKGHVDRARDVLQRMTRARPDDAGVWTELGVACIRKLVTVKSQLEQGDLAQEADAAFDRALAIDGDNWRARFYKATSLSFWPPIMGRQPEAIRMLEDLIDRQERMPPEPQFGQTYFFLGNLYSQTGSREKAQEVWRRGRERFPGHRDLARTAGEGGR